MPQPSHPDPSGPRVQGQKKTQQHVSKGVDEESDVEEMILDQLWVHTPEDINRIPPPLLGDLSGTPQPERVDYLISGSEGPSPDESVGVEPVETQEEEDSARVSDSLVPGLARDITPECHEILEHGCSPSELTWEPESSCTTTTRLRRDIHTPKRLTYNTLGKSSDEFIHSAQHSDQKLNPLTVPLVEDEPESPSDTSRWATNLLLTCHQNDLTLSDDLYNLLLKHPSVIQLFATAGVLVKMFISRGRTSRGRSLNMAPGESSS